MSYELAPIGVRALDTGEVIKPGDTRWPEYEAWLLTNAPGVPTPAEVPIEDQRREAVARVNGKRADMLQSLTAVAEGYEWDADAAAVSNLLPVVWRVQMFGAPKDFTWRSTANEMVPLTAPQLYRVFAAISEAREAVMRNSFALKAEISSADDPQTTLENGALSRLPDSF